MRVRERGPVDRMRRELGSHFRKRRGKKKESQTLQRHELFFLLWFCAGRLMVFPFLYELSSVARGKGMFEARWERGLEREVGAKSWGASNASVHSPSSEAAEPFPVGRRGRGYALPASMRGAAAGPL